MSLACRKYLFCLFLLFTQESHSRWSQAAGLHFKKYQASFRQSFEASVWGSLNNPKINKTKDLPNLKLLSFELEAYKKKVTAYFHRTQKTPSQNSLVVIVPGIFADLNADYALFSMSRLSKKGHDVLTLSNPWSKKIIKAQPLHPPGDIKNEALSYLQLIEIFLKQNNKSYKKVSLLGFSYGALLSSAINGLDKVLNHKINGQSYLISPPENLLETILNLDQILDQEHQRYKKLSLLSLVLIRSNYLKSKRAEELSLRSREYAAAIAAYRGFQLDLKKLSQTLYLNNSHNSSYYLGYQKLMSNPSKWRFSNYVDYFADSNSRIFRDPKVQLSYWLRVAQEHSKTALPNILSTHDDFLNHESQWHKYGEQDSLKVLKHGGHMGFVATTWFEEFLNIIY